ncbi:hypothetical protein SNEBB_002196 [Seison nebaliae]|nr:hypothetical protein SNEBB_002196 [Seison nebaliae]
MFLFLFFCLNIQTFAYSISKHTYSRTDVKLNGLPYSIEEYHKLINHYCSLVKNVSRKTESKRELLNAKLILRGAVNVMLHPNINYQQYKDYEVFMKRSQWTYSQEHIVQTNKIIQRNNATLDSALFLDNYVEQTMNAAMESYYGKSGGYVGDEVEELTKELTEKIELYITVLNRRVQKRELMEAANHDYIHIILIYDEHYWDVMLDIQNKRMIILDSFREATEEAISEYSQIIQGIGNLIIKDKLSGIENKNLEILTPHVSVQKNSYDCMFYLLTHVVYISHRVLPIMVDQDLPQIKIWLAYQLILNKIYPILTLGEYIKR